MKLIIAGSRSLVPNVRAISRACVRRAELAVYEAIESELRPSVSSITEVVSGGARGPDQIGEQWAIDNGIPVKVFKPDWVKFGRSAGIGRNIEMGKYADRALVLWDGSSHGSKQMIDWMRMYGKPVEVVTLDRLLAVAL